MLTSRTRRACLLVVPSVLVGVAVAPPAQAAAARTVSGWGAQIGNGTTRDYAAPVVVKQLAGARAIGGGDYAGYAITARSTVVAWGDNFSGQLGNGTHDDDAFQATPKAVAGLRKVTAVAGTSSAGFALTSDGRVHSWGANYYGSLGVGSSTPHYRPVTVHRLTSVVRIAAGRGGGNGADAVYALLKDHTLYAWGDNEDRQLGDGTDTSRSTPVRVKGLPKVVAVAAAAYVAWALDTSGRVWRWGAGARGGPKLVPGLTSISAITAADGGGWALRKDGTVRTLGYFGKVQVVRGVSGVKSLTSGGYSNADQGAGATCYALLRNGTVRSFGDGGAFGNGRSRDRSGPVTVKGLSKIVAVMPGPARAAFAIR